MSELRERAGNMSERLTYTSGAFDDALHKEFEERLAGMRSAAPRPFTHLIDGEASAEGGLFERCNPSDTTDYAAQAHTASAETVARAVQAARSAHGQWARTPHQERCDHMRAVARAIG
ncbi:MAG: aldehyde dehydrogenase family protein, partial [Solirubrobacteraceae bacterium]